MTLIQLYDIADQNKIAIYHYPLHPIKSASVPGTIGMDADQIKNNIEEKEVLAHELGHCIKYAFYTGHSPLELRAQKECRANKWAAVNLVPFNELMDALNNGVVEIWELAEHFEVSEDTIRQAACFYEEKLMNIK